MIGMKHMSLKDAVFPALMVNVFLIFHYTASEANLWLSEAFYLKPLKKDIENVAVK